MKRIIVCVLLSMAAGLPGLRATVVTYDFRFDYEPGATFSFTTPDYITQWNWVPVAFTAYGQDFVRGHWDDEDGYGFYEFQIEAPWSQDPGTPVLLLYYVQLSAAPQSPGDYPTADAGVGKAYPGGGAEIAYSTGSLTITEYVPEPGAAILALSGILALAAWKRFRVTGR